LSRVARCCPKPGLAVAFFGFALTTGLLLLSVHPAKASCTSPPASAHAPAAQLIARTGTIVLATAESAEERFRVTSTPNGSMTGRPAVKYTFATVETLKGTEAKEFAMEFWMWGAVDGGEADDFDHHRRPDWQDRGGRVGEVDPDCEVSPRFAIGARYLLFVDKPWHVLGFEQVTAEDDLWLSEVRRRIAEER